MFPRIGVCFAILGAALQLSAQVEQATLLGTITDSTAKVIPGASVTVLNLGTGERRATLSDDRGNYQVTALNIGAYEVTVEQPGFRKQTVSGITLVVNQVARIDVKLEVGQVTEELTVQRGSANGADRRRDRQPAHQFEPDPGIADSGEPQYVPARADGGRHEPRAGSTVTQHPGSGRDSESRRTGRRSTTTGSSWTARRSRPRCTERCACGHRSRRSRNSESRPASTTPISGRRAAHRSFRPYVPEGTRSTAHSSSSCATTCWTRGSSSRVRLLRNSRCGGTISAQW